MDASARCVLWGFAFTAPETRIAASCANDSDGESFSFSELALVIGVLGEKDAEGVLGALAPIADMVFLTAVDSPRTRDADELAGTASAALEGVPYEAIRSLPEALDVARSWAAAVEGRAVLVAGSVILAGEAIAHSRSEGWGIA